MRLFNNIYQRKTYDLALVIEDYLKYYEFNIPYKTIKSSLLEHPYANSIEAIKDSLKTWGMDCIALIGNKDVMPLLNYPCLIHINGEKGNCFIIEKVEGESIYINYPAEGLRKRDMNGFFQEIGEFNLIVPSSIDEDTYLKFLDKLKIKKKNERKQNKVFLILSLGLLFILIYNITTQLSIIIQMSYVILMALSFLGVYIGYLIQNVELKIYKNKILTLICASGKDGNNSCSDVINSKDSKLFGFVSLGDLVLTYFTFYILLSCHYLFLGDPENWIVSTRFLCLASVPFVVYSIIYQIYKKKYCYLCILVDVILTVKLIVILLVSSDINILRYNYSSLLTLIFWYGAISMFMWMYLKANREEQTEYKEKAKEYEKLKKRLDIFNCMVEKSKEVHRPLINDELTFENSNSKVNLVVWISFSCASCANTFQSILKSNICEIVKVTIRFYVNELINPLYKKIPQKLIAMIIEKKKTEAIDELSRWFQLFHNNNSIDIWLKDSDNVHEKSIEKANDILDLYSAWYKADNIIGTPTFILEDKIVPNFYDINEIVNFLKNEFEL